MARLAARAHSGRMSMPAIAATAPNTSFRSLVVPREHGSWSLALEPVALGLLVAPSAGGASLALAVAVVAGFFTRRPLKLAATLPLADPRRAAALRWTFLFATIALAALAAAAFAFGANKQQTDWRALWPLPLAAPFGAAFLWFDLRGEMREAEAELAGSAAFALVPAAFATLAGWSAGPALALAALMLARSVPTVLTVRAYLRIAKGKPAQVGPAIASALASLAVAVVLAVFRLVPIATSVFAGVLATRAVWLLAPLAPAWSARRVGMMEGIVGLAYLVGLTIAYRV